MTSVPRYFKHLPTPIRVLLRPWLLIALALHGVVLFLPLLPEPAEPEPEPELISLTELPPTAVPPSVLPSPAPSVPLNLAPVAPPPAAPMARAPVAPVAPTAPVAQPSSSATAAPTTAPSPSVSPLVLSSPVTSPSPTPEPSPTMPAYLANFPHSVTATACEQVEQCWRSPDSQWRGLARTLEADLATQGYTLTEMPLDDETGRRVYEVSKNNEVLYYLNVISTLEGTIYQVTEQPLTPDEMDAIAGF